MHLMLLDFAMQNVKAMPKCILGTFYQVKCSKEVRNKFSVKKPFLQVLGAFLFLKNRNQTTFYFIKYLFCKHLQKSGFYACKARLSAEPMAALPP
jgi:hypothetical protein